jgi:hypothetical protein
MSVGYQGSTTRHLTQHYNLYNAGSAHNIPFNPKVGGITYYANDGSARFNALLLEVRHAFSQSFQLNTQYRLSHSMDSGSNAYAGGFYQWNQAYAFGTSDYDTRHAFKVFGVWSPRIFRGSNDWLEKIAGGWSISGILNAHSGFPWTPYYGIGTLTGGFDPVYNFGANSGGSSGNAGQGNLQPAAYLGGYHPDFKNGAGNGLAFFTPPLVPQGTLFECLFPTAVGDPNCPNGQQPFGGLPSVPGLQRNSFSGPGYFDVDMTLSKSFGLPKLPILGESSKIEFRANFYNLFNKLNMKGGCDGWTGIQCDVQNSNFGRSGSALGARVIEMQARFSF